MFITGINLRNYCYRLQGMASADAAEGDAGMRADGAPHLGSKGKSYMYTMCFVVFCLRETVIV